MGLLFWVSSYSQDTIGAHQIMTSISNPLMMDNGKPVETPEQWEKERRPELLEFFTTEIYGQSPGVASEMAFEIFDEDSLALGGLASRKQVKILLEGSESGKTLDLLIYLPRDATSQVPVFLGLNFHGNQTINKDTTIAITSSWVKEQAYGVVNNNATVLSRGSAAKQWPLEKILKAGYGVATIHAGDIAPDFKGGSKMGVQSLYPELQDRNDNFSTMAAWAWGLGRAMDYLEKDKDVNADKVIVFGTSRLGKAALWAGAIDERFAMVISNESGAGGAKLYHHLYQEDIAQICRVFPYWFSNNFQKYAGRDENLPFDQHLMMSLIAPRPLLIASAKEAYVCDPYGEFLGAKAVSPVYEFLGEEPLPVDWLPEENKLYFGQVGYYMRSGKHDILPYDWEQFIAFANKHLK